VRPGRRPHSSASCSERPRDKFVVVILTLKVNNGIYLSSGHDPFLPSSCTTDIVMLCVMRYKTPSSPQLGWKTRLMAAGWTERQQFLNCWGNESWENEESFISCSIERAAAGSPCSLRGRVLQIRVYKFRAVRGGRRQLIASVITGTERPCSCQVTGTAM